MSSWKGIAICLLSATLMASSASPHEPPATQPSVSDKVPLYNDLGSYTYRITTRYELAQRYFDQGLRLTYAFNHGEARRAFQAAQQQDADCAMCYWGEAFVLGPNINAPMAAAATHPALAAMARARALAPRANVPEQLLIEALALRYASATEVDQATLNQAYATAMGKAVQRFPADDDIAVLYVDALMNVSPWDYWEADGRTPKGQIGEALRIVERVLARHPDHPGAIHLYIHLTEASATPARAEPYADRLAASMPGAGHLVHMPAHTFYRIGRYHDSVETNKAAVKADEAYLARVNPGDIYAYGYYPHNIHFVLTSALMAGDGKTSLAYAQRLQGKIPDAVAEQIGWIQVIKTAPYFAHAQFSEPATILALPQPGAKFPLVTAMWHYARGVAYAAQGEVEQARREAAAIAQLNQTTDFRDLLAGAVPAPDLLRLARHVIEGRIAQAQGELARAVKECRIAVAIQDALAYMEPPYWYYPVRQSLGAALLASGQAAAAEQVLQQSLKRYPRNGWALYGLMQAQQAQGKTAEAQQTEQRFKQAWHGDAASLTLKRL